MLFWELILLAVCALSAAQLDSKASVVLSTSSKISDEAWSKTLSEKRSYDPVLREQAIVNRIYSTLSPWAKHEFSRVDMKQDEIEALQLVVPLALRMEAISAGISDLFANLQKRASLDFGLSGNYDENPSHAQPVEEFDQSGVGKAQDEAIANIFNRLPQNFQQDFAEVDLTKDIAIQMFEAVPPHIRDEAKRAGMTDKDILSALQQKSRSQ